MLLVMVVVVHHGRRMRRIPLLQIVHTMRIAVAVARQVRQERIGIIAIGRIHTATMIVTDVPSNGASDLGRRSLPRTSTASCFGRRKGPRLDRVSLKGRIAAVVAHDVVAVASHRRWSGTVVSPTASH